MRTILFAVIAMFGINGHALANAECRTMQEVINYLHDADKNVEHQEIGSMFKERMFAAFSRPSDDRVMIVDFINGCMDSKITVTRADFEAWLSKNGELQ